MQSLGNYATQSVTYVSGTSVTHLSGLYKREGGRDFINQCRYYYGLISKCYQVSE